MRNFLFNIFWEFLQTNEMRSKLEFLDTVVVNAGVSVCVSVLCICIYNFFAYLFNFS